MHLADFLDLLRPETRQVELKGATAFEGDFRAHLTASMTAMANIPGGGTIIIGVKGTGVPTVEGLTPEQLATFDPTPIATYVGHRVAPLPRFRVDHFAHPDGIVVLVQVAEFDDVPIVVTKQIEDSRHKVYGAPGDLLIRSKSCECRRVQSADEFREILGRAMTKQAETLLAQIRAIMLGSPPAVPEKRPEALHQELLPTWDPQVRALAERCKNIAWWEVSLLPVPLPAEALEPKAAARVIEHAEVHWRGWPFPVLLGGIAYALEHVESTYHQRDEDECWQWSYRGAFALARAIRTDLLPQASDFNYALPPHRPLGLKDICWSVTEYFRFAANLAEALDWENIWMRIALQNVQDRALGAFEAWSSVAPGQIASTPAIVLTDVFTSTDLMSAWREHAQEWLQKIYTVFQWPGADRNLLADMQQQLFDRRW